MSYTANFSLNLGASNTGLSLVASIVGTDNKIVARNLTGIFEDGGGSYFWNYASFADAQRGRVIFHVGNTTTAVTSTWDGGGVTTIWAEAALDPELENADVKTSSRGTSTYAGGAVASVTGAVGSVTSPVALTSAYDAAKTAAAPGALMGIVDGAITSAKFTVGSTTGVVTGLLERIRKITNSFLNKKTGPSDGNGNLITYKDDGTTADSTQAITNTGGTITQNAPS